MNKTIIYYTSNREDERLEQNVRDNILKVCGDIPIVSVSQKPINFGKNICIGDVGVSGFNMFRQIQIALITINTQFVISAEADCLYPESYFAFTPPTDDKCYRTSDLYVMPDKRKFYFYKKEGATHGQIVSWKFYMERLTNLFEGAPYWSTEEKNFPRERGFGVDVFKDSEIEHFRSDPVVQIKTHKGMRYYTHSDRTPIYILPYWGEGTAFRKKYYE